MVWRALLRHMFAFFIFIASCAPLEHQSPSAPLGRQFLSASAIWNPNERTGLKPVKGQPYIEKLISVSLDPKKPEEGSFDLYYFVRIPAEGKLGRKTVLFCAGGPGEIVQRGTEGESFANFLSQKGYNVVYFHLRGTGFSQVPQSNKFDKFLRTDYAVEDVEKIRQDFLGDKNWDAIIGWSYGTVLAQQYAASKYRDKVGKMILMAPRSNEREDLSETAHAVRRETLKKIYESPAFEPINKEKNEILDEVFGPETNKDADANVREASNERVASGTRGGILGEIEEAFGSDKYVIDEYCDLKTNGELKNGLDRYSLNFFKSLRDLRVFGWKSFPGENNARGDQERIGKVIAVEINSGLISMLGEQKDEDECIEHAQGYQRTLYAMQLNDGMLSKPGNKAKLNKFIYKLDIDNAENMQPWDPAACGQDLPGCMPIVPTLILKGEADPVTAGGQAEYVFSRLLRGPRTLLRFPGIGHGFNLPQIEIDTPFLSGTFHFQSREIPPGVHRIIGRTDGLKLIKQLELNPPEELRSQIEVVSTRIDPGNIVTATILNRGPGSVPSRARGWTVRSSLFTGMVQFLNQKDISGGHIGSWVGKIVDVKLYQQIELLVPEELKPPIELLGAKFGNVTAISGSILGSSVAENRVTVIFRSGREQLPKTNNWVISNPFFTGTLQFIEKPTREREIVMWTGTISDVKVHNQVELVEPEDLESQIQLISANLDPEKENSVVATIKNITDGPVSMKSRNWIVRSPFYTAMVGLERKEILGRETVKVTGMIKNVKVKPQYQFDVKPSESLEPGLKSDEYQTILDENRLSVLVKNTSNGPVVGAAKNWTITSPLFTATVRLEPGKIQGNAK